MSGWPAVLKHLRIGLSRLLRYTFGGVFLLLLALGLDCAVAKNVLAAFGGELTAIFAAVIGVGVYATHRSIVIPLHHLGLCLLVYVWENWPCRRSPVSSARSINPVRWLRSISGVEDMSLPRRMIAYGILRHSRLFTNDEQEDLNTIHAEIGLVVMLAEGFFVAGLYSYSINPCSNSYVPLLLLSLMFLIASYCGAIGLHMRERMLLTAKTDTSVRGILREHGLIEL